VGSGEKGRKEEKSITSPLNKTERKKRDSKKKVREISKKNKGRRRKNDSN